MAKIKTNSNSITSILTVALNQESDFRKNTLKLLGEKIKKEISSDVQFYECTHSPLLYEEMKGKEIDIIARTPGKHKPVMMIEIKANINETLQDSQKENKEYQKTSVKYDIPLIYIIPKAYSHRTDLPKIAKIIEWEEILKECGNVSISFDTQINQFVELSYSEEKINDEERNLFKNRDLLLEIYKIKTNVLSSINEVLNKRNIDSTEEDQWGAGTYYHSKGENYFLGFNPYYSEIENGKYFFALDIAESCKNTDLENKKSLYFDDGYYYLPVLNNKTKLGDTKVVSDLREKLKKLKISSIPEKIIKNFTYFYSIRSKIGEELFDSLFNKDDTDSVDNTTINEKTYEKIEKKYFK